jgi:hypothetical protein
MTTAIQRGQASIYNGGLPTQRGGSGTMVVSRPTGRRPASTPSSSNNFQKMNQFAKDYKLITNGSKLATAVGLDKVFDKKTNGLYSDLVGVGMKHGYGKKKRKTKRKK